MTISMVTTSPQNSFLQQTQGYVQGVMLADPVANQWITTGLISASAPGPLWAGIPVTESMTDDSSGLDSGTVVLAATTMANITGFMIANQAYNLPITDSSNVPLATAGMSVSVMRYGSNGRIVVPIDSAAYSSLQGAAVNVQLAWDFTNNALTTYTSGVALQALLLTTNNNGKIVSYSSGNANWTTGPVAVIQLF